MEKTNVEVSAFLARAIELLAGSDENEVAGAREVLEAAGLEADAASCVTAALILLKTVAGAIPDDLLEDLLRAAGVLAGESEGETETEASLTPEQSEVVKAYVEEAERLRSELEAARKEAEEAREKLAIEELTKVARSELSNLPVKTNEMVGLLRQLQKSGLLDAVMPVLRASSDLIRSSGYLQEIGSDAVEDADSPAEKARAMARERVEKSGGKMTFAEALQAVYHDRPDLYEEYSRQNRGM